MDYRKRERNTESKDHDNPCQIIMYVNMGNISISVGLHEQHHLRALNINFQQEVCAY